MSNDTKLLRQYVGGTLRALVHRTGAGARETWSIRRALRETNGDGAQAEDVSQAVFTELARKSPPGSWAIPRCAGQWLVRTTVRRYGRQIGGRADHQPPPARGKKQAQSMKLKLLSDGLPPTRPWQRIQPGAGPTPFTRIEGRRGTREALVLRFLEDRPLREVGNTGASGPQGKTPARMRVTGRWTNFRGLAGRGRGYHRSTGLRSGCRVGDLGRRHSGPGQLWRRPSPAPHWPAERLPVQPP